MLVTGEVAIDFLGEEDARVLSTPHLIALMEWCCRNNIKRYLAEGWDSVGTLVEVKHLAATPVGMTVKIRSEVVKVEGQRVRFRVEAFDEREQVAEGFHERFVIEVARFVQRLAAKRAG